MKKYLSLIVATGFLIIALFSYQRIFQNAPISSTKTEKVSVNNAKIEITPSRFDLGTVVYGDVARTKFKIKNIGTAPLEISRLSTSCGCTKAKMNDSDKTIAPGDSVFMEVSFDPAVHKDDTDLGELTRTIYVESNDSVQSEVEVIITANVIKK